MTYHPDRRAVFEALDRLNDGEWQDVLETLDAQTHALRVVIQNAEIDALLKAIADAKKR